MNWLTRVILLAWVVVCVAPPAGAHVSEGLFRFLVPALDDPVGAAKFLKEQFAGLNESLLVVERELKQQEAAYQAKLGQTIPRLRFYEIYSGSAIGALWTRAQDPVDLIASMELLEEVAEKDLADLAWLERVKRNLKEKEASLLRYKALLEAFQHGVEARRHLLANVPAAWQSRREEFVTSSINDVWNSAMRDLAIVPYFVHLTDELSPRLGGQQDLLDESGPHSWTMSEESLNSVIRESEFIKDPRFYVRADHIYFYARAEVPTGDRNTSYHVVIVGWLDQAARLAVKYNLDAVYLDGVPIDVYDPQLRTPMILGKFFRLDFSSFITDQSKLQVVQHNGYLAFRTL